MSLTACVSNEGSGENLHMHMHRLTLAFTARICDKYQNPMSWLKHFLKLSKMELSSEHMTSDPMTHDDLILASITSKLT